MQFHDYKVHEKIPILKYLQVGKYVVQLIAVKDKEKNGANDKVNGGEWSLRSYGAGVADPRRSDHGDRWCVGPQPPRMRAESPMLSITADEVRGEDSLLKMSSFRAHNLDFIYAAHLHARLMTTTPLRG